MADVFICTTTYHFFITLVKRLTTPKYVNGETKVKLILDAYDYISEAVIERTRKSGLFESIDNYRDIDEKDTCLDYSAFYFLRHRSLQKQLDSFVPWKPTKGDEYYIYNDVTIMGKWLNSHRIKYHLIEDGLDNYKYNTYLLLNYQESSFKRAMRKFFDAGFYCFGESKYMIDLEVNSVEGLRLNPGKLKEVPRKILFEKLTEKDKKLIADIYLDEADRSGLLKVAQAVNGREASLLITQPFCNDGIMSEKMHLQMYQDIVSQHCSGLLVIKPHPRDKVDYTKIFPEAVIIDVRTFPIEIFGYIYDVHFKKAFTCCSTAVNNINYCDEKVICGLKYMDKYIRGDKEFQSSLSDQQIRIYTDNK